MSIPRPRLLLLLLVLLLLAASLPGFAQGLELRVFQLKNRPALATVEPVRLALSPAGTVVPDERTQTLIVRDTPEGLARVQALLDCLDVPVPQVRISVGFSGSSVRQDVAGGAAWDPATGQVRVAGGASEGSARTAGRQELLVMSGEEARLVVGRELAYVQPYWTVAHGYGLIPPGVVFHRVTTGFLVRPRVVGSSITLELTPWFSYDGPGGPGEVRFAEASSTVALRDGDTVTLGSGSSGSESSRALFGLILGGASSSGGEAASMTVTARIQPDWSRQ